MTRNARAEQLWEYGRSVLEGPGRSKSCAWHGR